MRRTILFATYFLLNGFCFGQNKIDQTKEYRNKIIPVLLNAFSDDDENRSYDCYYVWPIIMLQENLNVIPEIFVDGQDFSREIIQSSQRDYCILTLKEIKKTFKDDLFEMFNKANILTIGFVFNSIYQDENHKLRNIQTTFSVEIKDLNQDDLNDKLVKW